MEITKVVKPFIRRGANTFGNIVYVVARVFWVVAWPLVIIYIYIISFIETIK